LGDCLLKAVFLKLTKVAHIFGLPFPQVEVMYAVILTKTGLGYILVNFFTNSSGRPVDIVPQHRVHTRFLVAVVQYCFYTRMISQIFNFQPSPISADSARLLLSRGSDS
jgi:hypothetical protein